jgi:hypothetical protein
MLQLPLTARIGPALILIGIALLAVGLARRDSYLQAQGRGGIYVFQIK